MFVMIVLFGLLALAVLALITQAGVVALQRIYPQQGSTVQVAGAHLNIVDLGPRDAEGPPVVLLHGASSNLETMRPLGERLATRHRVILIDRPGHGWSARDDLRNATPAVQAKIIDEALSKLGLGPAIFVVHSLAGAFGPLMALDHAQRIAGLVMLAPLLYPWPGGIGRYNRIVTTPVIGPLLASTITMPVGLLLAQVAARRAFAPQTPPAGFLSTSRAALLLRPREFLANAFELVGLKAAVASQAPRYRSIDIAVTVITGDTDDTVPPARHSRAFAAAVPHARLIVLPGVGHMVQYAAPEQVAGEIEAMIAGLRAAPTAAIR
jgi:pimeloyl-ACP methyl ester carboxylesterase